MSSPEILNDTSEALSHQKIVEMARTDIGVFVAYVFDFPLAAMHKIWLRSMVEKERVLLIAPRGHGKTSLASIAAPCFFIGKNPNIRIKIISCSDDRAKDISFAIYRILKSNERFAEVFPDVKLDSKRVSKQKIYVQRDRKHQALKDATIESLGVSSAAEGTRANLLILDDVVSKRNCATAGLRTTVKEMYYNVHVNLLEPSDSSKIIYIGTVWDIDDLTVELMQKENSYDKQIYAIDEDFNPLWPDIWPTDKLKSRCQEIGLRRFNVGFRNQPASDKELLFSEDMFDMCKDRDLPLEKVQEIALKNVKEGRWKTAIGIDLASGALVESASHNTKQRRAYNAIVTLALDEEGRRIPISLRRFRAKSPEVGRIIIDDYNRFKPEVILIENNAQSALIEWLEEMKHLPIKTYFTNAQNKHDDAQGVRSLAIEFDNRMWRIPFWEHDISCKCAFCEWQREMLAYPFGRFTDTVMASWIAREGIRLHIEAKDTASNFSIWDY